jgi:hypothetical protein
MDVSVNDVQGAKSKSPRPLCPRTGKVPDVQSLGQCVSCMMCPLDDASLTDVSQASSLPPSFRYIYMFLYCTTYNLLKILKTHFSSDEYDMHIGFKL